MTLIQTLSNAYENAWERWRSFPPRIQRILLASFGVSTLLSILLAVFHAPILARLDEAAVYVRGHPFGWVILALFVIESAFLYGFSLTLLCSGYILGFPNGWFVVAPSTVLGASLAFLAFRYVLTNNPLARRFDASIKTSSTFQALSQSIHSGGFRLIVLIRVSPFPFSISNYFLAIQPPTAVDLKQFALATAVASPKLLIHVFIGSRLKSLTDPNTDGAAMVVNGLSIVAGSLIGFGVTYYLYKQTLEYAKRGEFRVGEDEETGLVNQGEHEEDLDVEDEAWDDWGGDGDGDAEVEDSHHNEDDLQVPRKQYQD